MKKQISSKLSLSENGCFNSYEYPLISLLSQEIQDSYSEYQKIEKSLFEGQKVGGYNFASQQLEKTPFQALNPKPSLREDKSPFDFIYSSQEEIPKKQDIPDNFFDKALCSQGKLCFQICAYEKCKKPAIVCGDRKCQCRIEHESQFAHQEDCDSEEMCVMINPDLLLKKIKKAKQRKSSQQIEYEKLKVYLELSFSQMYEWLKDFEIKTLNMLTGMAEKSKSDYTFENILSKQQQWFFKAIKKMDENLEQTKSATAQNGQKSTLLDWDSLEMTGQKISALRKAISQKNERCASMYQSEQPISKKFEQYWQKVQMQIQEKLKAVSLYIIKTRVPSKKPQKVFNTNIVQQTPSQKMEKAQNNNTKIDNQNHSILDLISQSSQFSEMNNQKDHYCNTLKKLFDDDNIKDQHKVPSKFPLKRRQNYSKIITSEKLAKDFFDMFAAHAQIKSFDKQKSNENAYLKLLYRATSSKFEVKHFRTQCQGSTNTVVLIKTQFKKIIGGFTPCQWKSNGKFEQDKEKASFLFSLTNKDVFPIKNGKQAIDNRKKAGPAFCGQPGPDSVYDLFICDRADTVLGSYALIADNFENLNYQKSTQKSFKMFQGSKKQPQFLVKEWQVYQIMKPFSNKQQK